MSELPTIGDYACVKRLGAGGQATTWLAKPADGGGEVLLKVFHVEVADDWKAAELFERAARVLESIDHPNIPAYHDHFEVESDGVVKLCLARDFVAGDSLQDRIDEDGSLSEDEVVELAIELLEVLQYLHSMDPPIVHRDIKPANVILGDDGRPYLVDFGAVQAEVLSETGGSTVVGTAGYVAPEQLMGRAEPSSDIYALGVTLVHLLTHTPPTELPSEGFELKFAELLEASAGLKYVVGRMTRADIDEREASAEGLLEKFRALQAGTEIVVRSSTLPVQLPRGSQLEVVEDEDGAVVVQSPAPVFYWHYRAFDRLMWRLLFGFAGIAMFAIPFALCVPVPVLAGIWMVGGVAAGSWLWGKRRRLQVELHGKALRLQLPLIRTTASPSYDLDGRRPFFDELNGEIQAPWDSTRILYRDLNSATVVRRDSHGNGAAVWKLRLDVDHAEARPSKMGGSQDYDAVSGPLVFELNFSHGEYLWLAKLINKRVAQYRELEE